MNTVQINLISSNSNRIYKIYLSPLETSPTTTKLQLKKIIQENEVLKISKLGMMNVDIC